MHVYVLSKKLLTM